MAKINVLIVDDHGMVRQGLRTYLSLMEDIKVVGEAQNGSEALAQVRRLKPEVVLMDLVMPEMDGIEATRRINELHPETKVIVLSSFTEDDKVFPAIKSGAANYLLKDIAPAELAEALFISGKTVKTYISNILGKLHLDDRTQAAIYVYKHGLVENK